MVKKSFRKIATIAGLTEQRLPGAHRSMKAVTFSTDLIYDVLHWLSEVQGQIQYRILPHASPLSIPALIQVSREMVDGEAKETLLSQAAEASLSYGEGLLETVKDYVANQSERDSDH